MIVLTKDIAFYDFFVLFSGYETEIIDYTCCIYYHHERIHQLLGRIIEPKHEITDGAEIKCFEQLGGLRIGGSKTIKLSDRYDLDVQFAKYCCQICQTCLDAADDAFGYYLTKAAASVNGELSQ